MNNYLLECQNINKFYQEGENQTQVLKGVSFAMKPFSESIVRNDSGRLRIFFRVNDIIIKNICIFVIGNGSGRFAATDEKGIR